MHGDASMKVLQTLNSKAVGPNEEALNALQISDCGHTDSQVRSSNIDSTVCIHSLHDAWSLTLESYSISNVLLARRSPQSEKPAKSCICVVQGYQDPLPLGSRRKEFHEDAERRMREQGIAAQEAVG